MGLKNLMHSITRWLCAIPFVLLLAACEQASGPASQSPSVGVSLQTGVVAETVEVDNYTYIRLEDENDDVWLATQPVWVSPGDVIEFGGGAVMKDFHSETLGRTFDSILFVENVVLAGQKLPPSTAAAVDPHQNMNMAPPQMQPQAAPAPVAVEPLDGGMTIEQIFAAYPGLDGQTVQLRAQVVKVNPNIMGKTWVTLQDGTGAAPNDKIVSTTMDTVEIGDVVEVSAIVRQDVSLGYGYDYSLLLEGATFTQEGTH